MTMAERVNPQLAQSVIIESLIMTSKTPSLGQISSLSYGMPDCPSCKKNGLVLTDTQHVACILCDYKRDFSKKITKPGKQGSGAGLFFVLMIVGFVAFVLVSSGG